MCAAGCDSACALLGVIRTACLLSAELRNKASLLPPVEADRLLEQDQVRAWQHVSRSSQASLVRCRSSKEPPAYSQVPSRDSPEANHLTPYAAGQSNFKELIWIILPTLVVFHIVVVVSTCYSHKTSVKDYFQPSVQYRQGQSQQQQGLLYSLLSLLLILMSVLAVISVVLMGLAGSVQSVYSSCNDPLMVSPSSTHAGATD